LAINFRRSGLRLLLRVYSALGHIRYGLFFLVAGNKSYRQKQG
jgi:hypothetical protein